MTSDKPRVRCPHCEEHIEAERLPRHRRYRNKFGIDVFECPECHREFKFEPAEYIVTREGIEKGTIPAGVAIAGVNVGELLPSETMALDYDRRSRAPWRKPAVIFSIVVALALAYWMLR